MLILYRLNPQVEFLMIKQKQPGLLSGLWSFFEINASEDLNERKRKDFIIEEIQRMSTVNIDNIKLAGQVLLPQPSFLIILFFSSVVIYFLILINNILYITLIIIKKKSHYPPLKSNGSAKINSKHQRYQPR